VTISIADATGETVDHRANDQTGRAPHIAGTNVRRAEVAKKSMAIWRQTGLEETG
jgi:hypothetical protein